MYKYSGAADLIISRAGATNLAEFAAQAKPCIIIPSPYLVGGHQLKNAKALAEMGAIEVLDENNLKTNPMKLLDSISTLMDSDKRRLTISENLFKIARNDAAEDLAKLILNQAKE
jgi:UDP-N-acetylglucosamine--N-acetylmuramyl-(pentapeptide) pyrophosphoryl-undecaprenol N-acetylglucosamine transferase